MLAHALYIFGIFSVGASIGFLASLFMNNPMRYDDETDRMYEAAKKSAPLLLLALTLFWPSPAKAECLQSAEAVWQAHPGSHATYRGSRKHACWFAEGTRGRKHEARSSAKASAQPSVPWWPVITAFAESRSEQALYERGRWILAKAMWAKIAEAGR